MDDAAFGLNECQRVFYAAGIRHILRLEEPPVSREILGNEPARPLPASLQALLEKTEPGGLTLWTYPELGGDLAGHGLAERSALFRDLVRTLAWPKGSLCFWPHTHWEQEGLQPRPDVFLAGLRQLTPQGLVVFGGQEWERLVASHEGLAQWLNIQRVPVLRLGPVVELLSGLLDRRSVCTRLHAFRNSLLASGA